MGCTVRELLARTDSRELAEWMAFFRLENEEADQDQGSTGGPGDEAFPQTPERQISIAHRFNKAIEQRKRQW